MNDARGDNSYAADNDIVRFQLTESISGSVPDRKAKGKLRRFVNGSYQLATSEDDFYDAVGDLDGASGDKGYARYFKDSRRYEILTLEC